MIVILALGHNFYGQQAKNLAISIKKVSPEVPIHLVHYGDAGYIEKKWFDSHDECPAEYITKNGKPNYFKAKTFIYDLSPFETTIYLDADMLWLRKPVYEVINELKDVDFTIANRGEERITEKTKWLWADPNEFKQFGEVLPNFHSEFIWFKKCERVEKYFREVQALYENPPIQPKAFAGDVADEYAFTIASVKQGVTPHKVPYVPTYWMFVDKHGGISLEYICNNFYCLSVGGSAYTQQMKKYYDLLVTGNARWAGDNNPWKLIKKRSYLAERATL